MSVGAVPALPSVVSGLNTTSPLRGSFAGPGPAWRFAGSFAAEAGRPERPPLHSLAGNLHISKQGLPLPTPHTPYLFGPPRNNVNNLPQHTTPQNVGAPVRGARTPRQRKRLRINRPPAANRTAKTPNNAITPGRMLCDSARCNVNHQKSLILRMRSLNATGNYWRKSFLAHAFDLSCHRWLSPCRHLRRWE